MSYQPQPANPPSPPATRPGELGDRFVARLIDGVLLAAVLVPVTLVVTVMTAFMNSGWLGTMVTSVFGAALGLGYFAYMESTRGQTVGKMVMKLQTLGPGGGNPTMEQAAKRNIWIALSLIGILPFLGGFIAGVAQLVAVITIAMGINNNTSTRQAWNDTFAGGTRVVKIG